MRLLDPLDFDSDGDGIGDCDDRFAWDQLQYGETFDDANLLPDLWENTARPVAQALQRYGLP